MKDIAKLKERAAGDEREDMGPPGSILAYSSGTDIMTYWVHRIGK